MYRSKDKTHRGSKTRLNSKHEKIRTSHGMRDTNRKNSQLSGYSSQINVELSGLNVNNSQSKILTPPNEEIKVSSGQMDAEIFPNSYDTSPYLANQVNDHQTI